MIYGQARTLLRDRRIELKMTQRDVCRKINMPQSTYSAIECGFAIPSEPARVKLDDLFNLPPKYWDEEGNGYDRKQDS